ncbi:MAG: MopE-related protein, partial [Myxococcota bacterium]
YDSTVNPGRAERWYDGVDQDCDGRDDDADDDGWGAADDCDDDDAAVNPDAEEVWYDGVDQDCDGRDDDADLDGFGVADDCDDTDAATHPDATEIWYDGVDQNCDGRDDDADLDGYGVADDCDDADPDVHPGVAEVCDGVDEDCDGEVDDDPTDGVTTFTDADGDGWGDDATERRACTVDVAVGGDCDDADPDASPDGVEVCGDGADNDCDGLEHGCGWSGTVDASTSAEATLYGGGLTAHMGAALASPGDVDGDGWNDLVVGAPEADYWPTEGGWLRSSVGLVWFTRGPFTGSHDQGAEGSSAFGDQANEDLGTALAAGADLTGDGVGDVLVGSPGTDDLLGTMAAGVVHLVDGTALPGMSDLDADAYGHLYGTGISDNVGSSLVMLGDVDGDGIADWAVGSPGDHGGRRDSGAAFVVSGALTGDLDTTDADTALYGEATYDLAAEVGSAGDTDGDGVAELLVGAAGDDDGATDAGAVYLVHLPAPGSFSLADADAKITGVTASGALSPAAGLGDTDGDGHDDLALGEPGASDAASSAGAVHVFRSSPTGDLPVTAADLRLDGALANDGAGDTVAGPGDVDGDGLADLIVGARIPSGRSDPYAWLVLGSGDTGTASLSTAHVVFTGASGSAVSAFGVGDLDGDGFDDVALGAELAPDPAGGYGLVWLFYGGP